MTCKHNKEHCPVCNEYLCFDDYGPELYRDQQVGGNHYADCAIQPADYAIANTFNYYESFVLKYITRHRSKGGKQDLEKAIHCLQLMIEDEYAVEKGGGVRSDGAMLEVQGLASISELKEHIGRQGVEGYVQGVPGKEPGTKD